MFLDYMVDDDFAFYTLYKEALLIKAELKTGKIIECKSLNDSKCNGLYNCAINCNDKIVFIPSHANNFLIVSKKDCCIKKIPIPNIEITMANYSYFGNGTYCFNNVYAFGVNYPGIVKIDLIQEKAELLVDLREFGCDGLVVENCVIEKDIYIPFANKNKLVKFNIEGGVVNIICTLDECSCGYKTISFDGDNFWIISGNNLVFRCDKNFECIIYMDNLKELIKGKDAFRSVFCSGYLYVFFLDSNKILKYSVLDQNDYLWISAPNSLNDLRSVYYVTVKDNCPCFYSESTNSYYRIIDDTILSYDIVNGEEYIKHSINLCGVIEEASNVSIKDFLKCI